MKSDIVLLLEDQNKDISLLLENQTQDIFLVNDVPYYEKHDYYDGPLSVTPSREAQVIKTNNLVVPGDIVVNPIPSNYGLVTYNGSIITVS